MGVPARVLTVCVICVLCCAAPPAQGSTSDSDNLDKFFSVGVRESTPDSDTVAADVDKPFVGFGGSGETAIGNLTVNDELLAHGVVIVGQPCSSATPCTSQWHHMVVSVGPVGGTVAGKHTRSMWLDGVLIASDVSGGALEIRGGSSSHFRVGAGGNRANGPNSGFWQGGQRTTQNRRGQLQAGARGNAKRGRVELY